MSLEITNFFKNYIKALNIPLKTAKNTITIVKALASEDEQQKTKWEVSLKLKKDKIIKTTRFLSMDGQAYSYKSEKLFLERLEIYNKIMDKKINKNFKDKIIACLLEFSKTPMDLYFGADIKNNAYLFSFWLIFGGVKSPTDISFWSYDFNKLIEKSLKTINFKKPKKIRKDILNFGFDVNNKNIFYKIYYLSRKKIILNNVFTNLMSQINKNLINYNYFYFFSELYNKNGNCLKKKAFIEFFDKLYVDRQDFPEFLEKILKIVKSNYKLSKLTKIFQATGGRISLISFELDNTITFYVRPD